MAVTSHKRLGVVLGAALGATVVTSMWASSAWVQANPGTGHQSLRSTGTEAEALRPRAQAGSFRSSGSGKQSSWAGEAILGLVGASLVARAVTKGRKASTACRVVVPGVAAESVPETLEAPAEPSDAEVVEVSRGELLRSGSVACAAGALAASSAEDAEAAQVDPEWVQYDLNTGETLYDIDFDDDNDPNHGFVVGARGLFYETKDGGKRWVSRSFANLGKSEDIIYRFQTVSINGDEVWIVGKPSLLLHSKNGGKGWKKVPVSRKLPGEPKVIVALGPGKAELATSSGAVYITENDGKNWKSKVQETVDATLNRVSASGVQGASYFTGSVKSIKRTKDGKYLAVAQRGNFYLSFNPGEPRWVPHNRISARRIQAMGFRETADQEPWEGAWMSLNGGVLTQCTQGDFFDLGANTKELFKLSNVRSGGIGIIDIAFRTPTEAWATGGSGVIYVTTDGGKTWKFDPSATSLPCNLYNVKFFNSGKVGYAIGSNGILLRRVFAA